MTKKELLTIQDNIYKLKYKNKILRYLNTLDVVYFEHRFIFDSLNNAWPTIFLIFNNNKEIQDVEIYK